MYSCILIIINFFLMSNNSFFFFFPFTYFPHGGCPSPWACGAYPRAGHALDYHSVNVMGPNNLKERERVLLRRRIYIYIFYLILKI